MNPLVEKTKKRIMAAVNEYVDKGEGHQRLFIGRPIPPETSWWTEPPTRPEFYTRADEELRRMKAVPDKRIDGHINFWNSPNGI